MAKAVAPILNPAPAWRHDLSSHVILWHGCTAFDKARIETNGIDLMQCAVDSDFGRGFYTTTLERQARHWAWDRYYGWRDRNPATAGNQPVVLRFRVRRYSLLPRKSSLDDGLDKLLSLHFVRGDYDNEDYWSLVQHCRSGCAPGPLGIAGMHDHGRPPNGWYEMVGGPVAAFWRQRVAMDDADQYSFHEGGIYLLQALIDAGKGKGIGATGDPDYYEWRPVT